MKKKMKILLPLVLALVMVLSMASVAQAAFLVRFTPQATSIGASGGAMVIRCTFSPMDQLGPSETYNFDLAPDNGAPSIPMTVTNASTTNSTTLAETTATIPANTSMEVITWTASDGTYSATFTQEAAAPAGDPPVITTTSLADGTTGAVYSQTLAASGTEPITWSLGSFQAQSEMTAMAGGALPPGLSLSGNQISGTPTQAGTYTFALTAANTFGSDNKAFSITVLDAGTDNGGTDGETPTDPAADDPHSTGATTTETSPKTDDTSGDLQVLLLLACAIAGTVIAGRAIYQGRRARR